LIAEGWDRFHRDSAVIACGVPAVTEVAARAAVLRVLKLGPDDVL
jgi:hypothetical protein